MIEWHSLKDDTLEARHARRSDSTKHLRVDPVGHTGELSQDRKVDVVEISQLIAIIAEREGFYHSGMLEE